MIPTDTTWKHYAQRYHSYSTREAHLLATEIYARYDSGLGLAEVTKAGFINIINEALDGSTFKEGHWVYAIAGIMQTGYWRMEVTPDDRSYLFYPSELESQRFHAFEAAANKAFKAATAEARLTVFKELPTASLDHYTKSDPRQLTHADITREVILAFVAKTHTYASDELRSFAITIAEYHEPKTGYASIPEPRLGQIMGLTVDEVKTRARELGESGLWKITSGKGKPTRYSLTISELHNLHRYMVCEMNGAPFADEDIVRVKPTSERYSISSDVLESTDTAW